MVTVNRTRLLLYSALAAVLLLGLWAWSSTGPEHKPDSSSQLEGLGYLSGYERTPGDSGVTVHEPQAWKGYTLYVSGDGPTARLIDMAGRVVHRWEIPWEEAFGDSEPELKISSLQYQHFLRKFHVQPNGDLIGVFEDLGMVKINRDSEVLWARLNYAHHDLWTQPDTHIYVLTREPREMQLPDRTLIALDDEISVYSDTGQLLREFSIYRSIKNSRYRSLLSFVPNDYDLFHTNTLTLLDSSKVPASFEGGDALIIINHLRTIAVVDLQTEKITWAMTGRGAGQHDATLLESGNLMFLDNGSHRGQSTVRVVDPITRDQVWNYTSADFNSKCCGTNQRMPNGNTLITETSAGRIFEVTPDKKVVWEFINPYRGWNRHETVASIYAAQRFPKDYFDFLRP